MAGTFYFSGDFSAARKSAMRGVEIWRSGGAPSHAEFLEAPAVVDLCYVALSGWHFGGIPSWQVTIAEAISLAKELNDINALAFALFFACWLAQFARHPGEVERLASDLTELSTPQSFAFWLAAGKVFRGWARSASDNTVEGIVWIEQGIADWVATGATLGVPYYLALKAEALYLTNRTSDAVVAIEEAEALAERSEERHWCAELPDSGLFFSRPWVPMRLKLRLHFVKPSESQRSRSRFR